MPTDPVQRERHAVIAGCEAWWHDGGEGVGALCLHGFTGTPLGMRPVAEALAVAGYTVSLPRLPGHATHIDDLLDTTWDDWLGEAERAYVQLRDHLAERHERVRIVVCGLSMGAALAACIAAAHPEVAGLVTINGALAPATDELRAEVLGALASGAVVMPPGPSDIAKPGATEHSYPETPLRPLLSMIERGGELPGIAAAISCPALVMHATNDHVIAPSASDWFAAHLGGAVERLTLERSYHVATVDHDGPLVAAATVRFADRVCRGCAGADAAGAAR